MSTPSTKVRYWVGDQRHPRLVSFKSYAHALDFIETFIGLGMRAEVQLWWLTCSIYSLIGNVNNSPTYWVRSLPDMISHLTCGNRSSRYSWTSVTSLHPLHPLPIIIKTWTTNSSKHLTIKCSCLNHHWKTKQWWQHSQNSTKTILFFVPIQRAVGI